MVKTKARKQTHQSKAPTKGPAPKPARAGAPAVAFSRINAIYLGAGTVAIGAGFYLLAQGSMVLAPVLLVLGYCVLLPIGIIKK